NPPRPGGGDLPPVRTVKILLVDDQPNNLLALEAVLDHPEYNLVKAHSGEEALRRLLRDDFALILLDVLMPGMDGFETAELIRHRERIRYTPIIFVTAIGRSEAHVARGYSCGAVDYLFKPLVPEVLRSKVAVFSGAVPQDRGGETAGGTAPRAGAARARGQAGRGPAATGGGADAPGDPHGAADPAEALPDHAADLPGPGDLGGIVSRG